MTKFWDMQTRKKPQRQGLRHLFQFGSKPLNIPFCIGSFCYVRDAVADQPFYYVFVGCRFCYACEPPKRMLFDTALLKSLLGRDSITARHLYQRETTFIPKFRLLLLWSGCPSKFHYNRIPVNFQGSNLLSYPL